MAMAMRHSFKHFDQLKKAGMPERQALIVMETIEEASEATYKDLATKTDLEAIKSELASKADLAAAKSELASKADLAAAKAELASKTDLTALRPELKADLAAATATLASKAELDLVKTDINWLKRLFMSSVLMILLNIIITLLHH